MTQNSSAEFAQPPQNQHNTATKQNCDILLNNFQIKKKRYRVLLNYDHIVWERWDAKQRQNDAERITKKEAEIESEQLSNKATYGNCSNVVHINEIISVTKGVNKSDTFRKAQQPSSTFGVSATVDPFSTSSSTPPTEQYLTIHYAERVVKSPTDCNRWRVRTLTLYNADAYIVQQWHALLMKIFGNSARLRVKRLLVFINPYGGRKQGLSTYERHCKPIFQLAGIDASCIISQRANQIRDILMSHDLTPFDAVCCVGGDGTVAEVINGLIFRRIHDLGMDARRPEYIPKPTLTVGIIPAGSTDTVAYSLHGTSDVRTAALHLILGQRRGLDICSVRNTAGIIRFCASVFSYGYLGDVAAKSENYRWMGTKRYEYTGVRAFLLNRGYEAEIRMLLADDVDSKGDNEKVELRATSSEVDDKVAMTDSVCYANCQRCSVAVSEQEKSLINRTTISSDTITDDDIPTSSIVSLNMQKSIDDNACINDVKLDNNVEHIRNINMPDCDTNAKTLVLNNQLQKDSQIKLLKQQQQCDTNLEEHKSDKTYSKNITAQDSFDSNCSIDKPINDELSENWHVIKGSFFMISGANITCACTRSPNGISRYSHLGDGNLDLILVRKTSLLNNVRFVINSLGRNGDIRNLPFVEVYRTRKFCVRTPYSVTDEEYSIRGSCQPITETEVNIANISSWNCDGEVVNDLDVTMSSHCQLIDVFMRGPYSYCKPLRNSERSSICC